DLPARAVGYLVDPVRYALAGEVLSRRFEATAAERDMIDDAGIGALLLVGLGDVVEVQHGMVPAVQPGAGKIERWARTVLEPQHVLIELHCLAEFAGRYVVVVESAHAHFHRNFSSGFRQGEYGEMRPLTSRLAWERRAERRCGPAFLA